VLIERQRAGAVRRRMRVHDIALVAVIGLIQTSAVMVLLFVAMRSISASTAAILLFTNPIWVAVLGRIFLRETLDGAAFVGLALGVIGVALAVGLGPATIGSPGAVIGEITAVASAMCWAVATIITKRAELPLGTWTLTFWQMLIGSSVVLALAYATGERWPASTTPAQWGWFLWLAIPSSTGSFGLWFAALAKGGATRASSYLFLAPLLAVITSFLVLGTTLSWLQGLGGALIGLAIWLINRERRSLKGAQAEGEL
jgi:drug/metabolite transporter (DMT)-like permease